MKNIGCRRCPFAFHGDVVCMNCATGYALNMHHPQIGDSLRLTQVFRMETQRVDGKTRCTMHTESHPTDEFVTVVGNGTFINLDGEDHEGSRFPVEYIPCPSCSQLELRFYFDKPDRCPQCNAQSLYVTGTL